MRKPLLNSLSEWSTKRSTIFTVFDVSNAVKPSRSCGALLKNLRQLRPALVAQPEDFSGALVYRSGLLALYIACVQRGILDFFTGAKVLLQNAVDRHHILPRGQFPEDARTSADNVAKRIESRVLRSQCVPSNQKLWAIDRAEEFWAARRDLLAEAFNDFLRDSFPTRRLGSG